MHVPKISTSSTEYVFMNDALRYNNNSTVSVIVYVPTNSIKALRRTIISHFSVAK